MEPIRLLRSELHRSLHGPAWHGPALLEALADVSEEEARARVLPGAHTIAELALHCLAWIEEVTRRAGGARARDPQRGDWPLVPELDRASWTQIQAEIASAGSALDVVLASLPAPRLGEEVAAEQGSAGPGSGVTLAAMLHGLAQHHAYHGGQVSLLKRGLRQ